MVNKPKKEWCQRCMRDVEVLMDDSDFQFCNECKGEYLRIKSENNERVVRYIRKEIVAN